MARSVPDLADILNVVTGTDPGRSDDRARRRAPPGRLAQRPRSQRAARASGSATSRPLWDDPFGTTGTTDAEKAALKYLTDAGATIVEMGSTVGDAEHAGRARPPTRPATPRRKAGCSTSTRIRSSPQQGFQIQQRRRRQLLAEEDLVHPRRRQRLRRRARRADDRRTSSPPAATTACQYKANATTWLNSAGADDKGVDAVVYPGLLSDITLNDGGGGKASFGRRDTPGASAGIPTVDLPRRLQRPRPADQPPAARPRVG